MENENIIHLGRNDAEDQDFLSNVFVCPCCGKLLQFRLRIQTGKVVEVSSSAAPSLAAKLEATQGSSLNDGADSPASAAMRACGMWEAFETAFHKIQVAEKPKSSIIYAQRFMTDARKLKRISPSTMRELIMEFGKDGKIEVWGAQYMAAIVVNGNVKAFMPMSLIKGETFYRLTPTGGQLSTTGQDMTLPIWIRSKYGYVVGRGAMFNYLQKRSIGDFAAGS